MRVLILEDNRDRRVAMMGRLADRFPFLRVVFFDASAPMIEFMSTDPINDIALISLDHDLDLIPGLHNTWIDPGTGLDVAKWMSDKSPPICPVVVHTTNFPAGDQMLRALEEAGWKVRRVVPHDDLHWIDSDWFPVVRDAIVETMPKLRASTIGTMASKISLIRSLLDGNYQTGQAFCRAAFASIAGAYEHDLRPLLGNATVEMISSTGEETIVSVMEIEGPVMRWARKQGLGLGNFRDFAGVGAIPSARLPVPTEALQLLIAAGVEQIFVTVIEIAHMQALLVVSAREPLTAAEAIIIEMKQAIEIALHLGLQWQSNERGVAIDTEQVE